MLPGWRSSVGTCQRPNSRTLLLAVLLRAPQQEENLQLVHGDVLQLNLQELIDRVTLATQQPQQPPSQQQGEFDPVNSSSSSAGQPRPQQPSSKQQQQRKVRVKVVANLPYNITKDFLLAMFPKGDLISELSIMIQVRVVGRVFVGSREVEAVSS